MRELPRDEFLLKAWDSRQDPDAWERRARALGAVPPEARDRQAEWGTQPNLHTCADHIIRHRHDNPLRDGVRHVVLFNLAKMLANARDFSEEEVRHWLGEVNAAATRPISHTELERIVENVYRGQFTSTGCDDPQMVGYTHPDCPIANG